MLVVVFALLVIGGDSGYGAVNLYDLKGYRYDIYDGCYMSDGEDDSYDGYYELYINGTYYSGVINGTEENGREVVCAEQNISGILVHRKVYVPTTQHWARYLEILHNPTNTSKSVRVKIGGDLGSDSDTVVVETSDGDSYLETGDRWFVTDDDCDGCGDPSLAHVFDGENASISVYDVYAADEDDNPYYAWYLSLAPGGTVVIMHFAVQQTDNAAAISTAKGIRVPEVRETVEGMSLEELAALSNWRLDLYIYKSAPSHAVKNQIITYNITYFNYLADNITGVTIYDYLPPEVSYISDTCGGSLSGITLVMPIGNLSAISGGYCLVNVSVKSTAPQGSTINNTVNATYYLNGTLKYTTAEASTEIVNPEIEISKESVPCAASSGEYINYTIHYTNPSIATARNVVIRDYIPAGLSYISDDSGGSYSAGVVTFNLGDVAPNQSGNITITTRVSTSVKQIVKNNATVEYQNDDGVSFSASASVLTPVNYAGYYTVDAHGNGNFSTIASAINSVPSASKILVCPGIYTETLIINKSLTIEGAGADATTVDGNGSYSDVIRIESNNVNISHITLKNGGHGVYINNVSSIEIRDTRITSNKYDNLYIYSASDVSINNTNITDSLWNDGIDIRSSSNIEIINSIISGNDDWGIYAYDLHNSSISGNVIESNRWYDGIYLQHSSDNSIIDNIIRSNNEQGIELSNSNGNLLENNRISNNYDGIYLYYSSNNTLINNTVENNSHWGIGIDYSNGNRLRSNTMRNNQYNFDVYGNTDSHYAHDIDTSNTVDGRLIYYLKNVTGSVYGASANIGTFYCIWCSGITIRDQVISNETFGIYFWKTSNSVIDNITIDGTYQGIYLQHSNGNNISRVASVRNPNNGMYIYNSSANRISNCNLSYNGNNGISLDTSSSNTFTGLVMLSNGNNGFWISQSTSNTIENSVIAGSRYDGIYMSNSNNNTVLNTTVVNSTSYDFELSNSANNTGINNTCDKPDGWNDLNAVGCTYLSRPLNTYPDLIITELGWSPTNFNVGTWVTLRATVKNTGYSNVSWFYVGFYINGNYIGRSYISGLGVNQSLNVTLGWYVNTGGSNVTFTARADSTNRWAEINESNNEQSTFLPYIGGADLIISNITWSPANITPGATVTFTVTVKNTGDGTSRYAYHYIHFYLDGNQKGNSYYYGSLAPNATFSKSFTINGFYPGNHTVKAIVDKWNYVPEKNESNNILELDMPYIPGADLIIGDINWSPANFSVGDSVNLTAIVENIGDASTGNQTHYVAFYIDGNYIATGSAASVDIPPGGNITVKISWTANVGGAGHNVSAKADQRYYYGWYSYIYELNESNNLRKETLPYVNASDLIITDIIWSPANYSPGEPVTFSAVVKNVGNISTGIKTHYVAFYIDGNYIATGSVANVDIPPGGNITVTASGTWVAQGGNHTVGARADLNTYYYYGWREASYIVEINESNNYYEEALPSLELPDLLITHLLWAPNVYSSGDPLTLNATVKNAGNLTWNGSVKVNFYYLNTTYIGTATKSLYLPPGASGNVTFNWAHAKAGDFYFRATVDPNNAIQESNENNNHLYIRSPNMPQPDLIVDRITLNVYHSDVHRSSAWRYTTSYPGAGWQNSSFDDSNWSVGQTPIGDSGSWSTFLDLNCGDMYLRKKFNASGNGTYVMKIASDDGVDVWINDNLALNRSSDVHGATYWNYQFDITPYVVAGENTIAIYLRDKGCGGNYFDAAVVVNRTYAPENATIDVWDSVVITATVKNIGRGNLSWGGFNTYFTIAGSYATVTNAPYKTVSIPVNGTADFSYTWNVRYPGNYTIQVKADSYNNINDESNESNNLLKVSIKPVKHPDLIVENISWTPENYTAGTNVRITATIKNIGEGYARDFYTMFYVDGNYLNYYGTHHPSTIAPGESINVSATWTAQAGTHVVKVVVDNSAYYWYRNLVRELNESNNVLEANLTPVEYPDIVIAGVTASVHTDVLRRGLYTPGILWRYTTSAPGAGWQNSSFDDSNWSTGEVPIGDGGSYRTYLDLACSDMYLRKKFNASGNGTYVMKIASDDGVDVWINGNLALNRSSDVHGYSYWNYQFDITPYVVAGENTIAVYLRDKGCGGNYFDAAVTETITGDVDKVNYTYGDLVTFNAAFKNTGKGNISTTTLYTRFTIDSSSYYVSTTGALPANSTLSALYTWRAQPGAHTITVDADAYNYIKESDEGNNRYQANISLPYPDLVVERLNYSPATFVTGQPVTLRATVRNNGTGAILSGNYYYERVDFYIDNTWVCYSYLYADLYPGESINLSCSWSATPGSHTLKAVVDTPNRITESNESNNALEAAMARVEPPDLVVENISWSPQSFVTGDRITITATVKNIGRGNLSSGYRYVAFYVDGNHIGSPYRYTSLTVNESFTVSVQWYVTPGNHTIRVVADSNNAVPESNETNNALEVALPVIEAPDLIVENISWAPQNFVAGDLITLTATVRNIGAGSVSSYGRYIHFYIDGGYIGYAYSSAALSPNQSFDAKVQWRVTPGNHTLKVVVDTYNHIPESNESNNALELNLPVVEYPDLIVENVTWQPLSINSGERVTLTATIKNIGRGNLSTLPRYVGFYIDGTLISNVYNSQAMSANSSFTVSAYWMATPGNHTLKVVADSTGGIRESNESNNIVELSLPEVAYPDLVVSNISWSPAVFNEGESVTFSAEIKNVGTGTIAYSPLYAAFYLDGNYIGYGYTVTTLSPNQTVTLQRQWTATLGNHTLEVVVDYNGRVAEANESNNRLSVSLPQVARSNLNISSVEFVPLNITDGDTVTVKVNITNTGSTTYRRFKVGFKVDGTLIAQRYVHGLSAGSTTTVSAPWKAYPGNHTLEVLADYSNEIQETNESDNTFVLRLPEVPRSDLEVVNLSWEPASFSDGERVLMKAQIKNTGSTTKRDFYVTMTAGNSTFRIRIYGGMAEGEVKNLSAYWLALAGSHTYTVTIDPEGYIDEDNESNNNITVALPYVFRSDLKVLDIQSPAVVEDGDDVFFNITIGNTGNGNTTRRIAVRVELDGACQNRTCTFPCIKSPDYSYVFFQNLASGENATQRTVTPWKAYYGNHTISATVDFDNSISEENESNNQLKINVTVVDTHPPYIKEISVENGSVVSSLPNITVKLYDDYGSGVDLSSSYIQLFQSGIEVTGTKSLSDHTIVFTPDVSPGEGVYKIRVTARDNVGLVNISEYTVEVDRTEPSILITGVAGGMVYSSPVTPHIYITDRNLEDYTIEVNGKPFSNGSEIGKDGAYTLRVTARDLAGNTATRSVNFSIDLRPLPPSGLVVQRFDHTVELSWYPNAESDIAGYNVYADGVKVNSQPVGIPTFTLNNISNASHLFQVTAVDKAGQESDFANASKILLDIVGYGSSNLLHSGLPEQIKLRIENQNDYQVDVASYTLELLSSTGSVTKKLTGSGFSILPRSSHTFTETVVPYDTSSIRFIVNLSDGTQLSRLFAVNSVDIQPVSLNVPILTESYRDGFEIHFTNNGSAPVSIKGTDIVVELINYDGSVLFRGSSESLWEYIMPGETAIIKAYVNMPSGEKVHLENLSLRVSVPTYYGNFMGEKKGVTFNITQNVSFRYLTRKPIEIYPGILKKGTTSTVGIVFLNQGTEDLYIRAGKATISVKDANGSIYATGNNIGNIFVRSGDSATFYINVTLPTNTPDRVALEANINASYITLFNTGNEIPFNTSVYAYTVEPPYNANATTDKPYYNLSSPVHITGYATYTNGSIASNVTLRLVISSRGFQRIVQINTHQDGSYSYTFTPAPTEAGKYTVSVTHPDVKVLENDAEFEILGLFISRLPGRQLEPYGPVYHVEMSKNSRTSGRIRVNNLGSSTLNAIRVFVVDENPTDGVDVVADSTLFTLQPGESRYINLNITAGYTAPENASFRIYAVSYEGAYSEIPLNVKLHAAQPRVSLIPWNMQTGVKPGDIRTESIKIENTGYDILRNITIIPPNNSWIRVLDRNISDIPPGNSSVINILIAPPENLPLGVYEDNFTIKSSNHQDVVFRMRFFVTSALTGDLKITVKNQLGDALPGAQVSIIDEATYTQSFTVNTDENGTARFTGIPSGRYQYRVRIPHHTDVVGTVEVQPGTTTEVEAVAQFSFLEVEWSVVPIQIKDKYEIVHNITYETRAPVPYIKMDYTFDEILIAPGGVYYGNVTITNMNDIVSAFNVTPVIGRISSEMVTVEFGVDVIPELKPHESVTIPFVVKVATHHSPKVKACDSFTITITLRSEKKCIYSVNGKNVYVDVPVDTLTIRLNVACLEAVRDTAMCIVDIGTACEGSTVVKVVKAGTDTAVSLTKGDALGAVASAGSALPGSAGTFSSCFKAAKDCYTSSMCNGWAVGDCVAGLASCATPCGSCISALNSWAKCFFQDECCSEPPSPPSPPLYVPPAQPVVVGGGGFGGGGGGGYGGWSSWTPSPYKVGECITSPSTQCIKIKLEIKQELTLERQAFDAMLRLKNIMPEYDMNNISVKVIIKNTTGDIVNNLFFMRISSITGIDNVDNGTLPAAGEAEVHWLIIPTPGAGGNTSSGVKYTAEAEISYAVKNKTFNLTTIPDDITVMPMPMLTLDYVLPYRVYGDDPMTQGIIEPPQPFVFGVRVNNSGYGTAKNLAIDSAQPRIVESYGGGVIDFKLLGAYVDGKLVENSLKVTFGDVPPHSCAAAGWQMQVSVTGNFTEYNASFTHSDTLGGKATSLLKEIKTHVLIKEFMNDRAGRDKMFDFLIDNVTYRNESDGIPDYIIDSQCMDEPVYPVNSTTSGTPSMPEMKFDIVLNSTRGSSWIYTSVPDPMAGRYEIARVVGEDGRVLNPLNYWIREGRVHIVDHDSVGRYTVYYKVPPNITKVVVTPQADYAIISWWTDKPASGKVKVGSTPEALKIAAEDRRISTYHALRVENLQPNTTYYLAVNSTDFIGVSTELKPLSFTTVLPADPDFTVGGIYIQPSNPVAGDIINISVYVQNLGNLSVQEPLNVTLSVNGTVNSRNVSVTNISSVLVNFSLQLPAGNHTLTAEVDSANKLNETDESNNRYSVNLVVAAQDTFPPAIDILSPANTTYNTSTLNISVHTDEPANVSYSLNNGSVVTLYNSSTSGSKVFTAVEGSNSLVVYAVDASGNLNSSPVYFTVDTTPPTLTFVSPTPADGDSIARSDIFINITSNEPLASATLEFDGVSYTMQGSGTSWYYYLTGVGAGIHSFRVVGVDTAGNSNTTELRSINITIPDTTPPSITILSPANTTYSTTSLPLQVYANEPISSWLYSLDGVNTSFTPNTTLQNLTQGVHTLVVYATDASGNTGSASVVFTVLPPDTTPPTVTFVSPTPANGSLVNTSHILINITLSEAPDTVLLIWNGTAYSMHCSGLSCYLNLTGLADGYYTYAVYANDSAGNSYTTPLRWLSVSLPDTTPPLITLITPVNGSTLHTPWLYINMTASEPLEVAYATLNGTPYNLSYSSGSWNVNITGLMPGNYTVSLTAVDLAGNAAVLQLIVSIADIKPPSVAIYSPLNTTYSSTSVTAAFSVEDDFGVSTVNTTLDGTPVSFASAGGYYTSLLNLTSGSHIFQVNATDTSGNSKIVAVYFTVNTTLIDTTPPLINISAPKFVELGQNYSVVVTIYEPQPLTYNITRNGNLISSGGYIGGVPEVISESTTVLGTGTYVYEVCASDSSNNTACANATVVVRDTTPPALSIYSPQNATYTVNTLPLNVSSNEPIDIWWYSLNGGGNTTFTPNTTVVSSEGVNHLVVYANDSAGNIGKAEVYFTVDTIPPAISFVSPTPASGSTVDVSYFYINITSSEPLNWAVVEWLGTNITMTGSGKNWHTNLTSLADGTYAYRVWVADRAGNVNLSELRTVRVATSALPPQDTQPPTIVLQSPVADAVYTTGAILLNLSTSESATVVYSLNGAANVTLYTYSTSGNAILNLTEGINTLVIYATDVAGNTNTLQVKFSVDTQPPAISVHYPLNNSALSLLLSYINFSVSDTSGVEEVELYINDNLTRNYTFGFRQRDFIWPLPLQLGQNTVEITARDIYNHTTKQQLNISTYRPVIKIVKNVTPGVRIANASAGVEIEIKVGNTSGSVALELNATTNLSEITNVTTFAVAPGEKPIGKFVSVKLSGAVSESSNISYAILKLAFTLADLDANGNGSVNLSSPEKGDIDPQSLRLYRYCPATGEWQKVEGKRLICGNDTIVIYSYGVNTTNISAMYVWANLSHLSVYGIGGSVFGRGGSIVSVSAPGAAVGGAVSHSVAIEAVESITVEAGKSADLLVKILSAARESGVSLAISNLPEGWKSEALSGVSLMPGRNNFTLKLAIPQDAEGNYTLVLRLTSWLGTFEKKFRVSVVSPEKTVEIEVQPEAKPKIPTPAPEEIKPAVPEKPAKPKEKPAPKVEKPLTFEEKPRKKLFGICGPSAVILFAAIPLLMRRRQKQKA